MQHILGKLKLSASKARETERGEMMRYFCRVLNGTRMRDGLELITMPRMGKILEGMPTKDLYYLKRVCDDAHDFSKKFWWELNPENHTDAAKKARATQKPFSQKRG